MSGLWFWFHLENKLFHKAWTDVDKIAAVAENTFSLSKNDSVFFLMGKIINSSFEVLDRICYKIF